jgi:hypothetical protein
MKLRRSLYARPVIVRGQHCTAGARAHRGAGRTMTLRRLCPELPAICQQPSLTSPQPAPCRFIAICLLSSTDMRQRVVCVLRCERAARQWHARGQGFKSPQLHQAQRIGSTAEGRLSADCLQITCCDRWNALSVDRFGCLQHLTWPIVDSCRMRRPGIPFGVVCRCRCPRADGLGITRSGWIRCRAVSHERR